MFYNVLLYVFTGKLSPPQQFQMNISNISVTLSWVAPDSLQVSTPPTISHYVLSNNLTNGTKKFNNPTTCNPLAYCNYSLDLRDPFFTCVGCYGGENMTILDYNGIQYCLHSLLSMELEMGMQLHLFILCRKEQNQVRIIED